MKDRTLPKSALWRGTGIGPLSDRAIYVNQTRCLRGENGHDRSHGHNPALPPLPQAFPTKSKKLVASLRHEDPQEPVSAQVACGS